MPPKIVIKEDTPKPPTPSFEERIKAAAEDWKRQNTKRIDKDIAALLDSSLRRLILESMGFSESWGKVTFSGYGNSETASKIRELARDAVLRLFERIDFSTVELSTAEIKSIKAAYRSELKEAAIRAAKELALRDALNVAEQVIGIKLNNEDFVEGDDNEVYH